jgi:hypothetical protein
VLLAQQPRAVKPARAAQPAAAVTATA